MESHKIMCHFLYYCFYWLVFGLADRIYDISSASGNNNFQVGVWMLLWLSTGLPVKTCHFLDLPLVKSWKFWPIWLVSEFKAERLKAENICIESVVGRVTTGRKRSVIKEISLFSEFIWSEFKFSCKCNLTEKKKVDSDKRFSAFCPDAEWCSALHLSCCQREA